MPNIQDFRGEDCAKLVPQGDVLMEQQYVGVTQLNVTLDDEIIRWERDDGTLLPVTTITATVGLPPWLIDPDDGADAVRPKEFPIKGTAQKLVAGVDLAFLPGLAGPLRTPRKIIRVTQEAVKKGNMELPGGVKLTQNANTRLLKTGEVQVATGDVDLIVRMTSSKHRHELRNRSVARVGSTAFSLDPLQGWDPEEIYELLRKHFGSLKAVLEALFADPRSGPWYQPDLPTYPEIDNLADGVIAALIQYTEGFRMSEKVSRDAPTPKLPSFPIAVVNVFNQILELKGFSRGRLVNSVTLGPEESVSMEVFTWDRAFEERAETFSSEHERNLERERKQSITSTISSDLQSTIGVGVGGELGLGMPIKMVDVKAGISGDVQTQISNGNQNTVKMLSEATAKASERFKASHQVKIRTRRETGIEERVTRTFQNPNLGRTLHLHHFEILGHYSVRTNVDETQRLALLVENPPIGPFNLDWVRAHHHFLDEALLHDAYRNGLGAAQIIAANEWLSERAATEKRAREDEEQRRTTIDDNETEQNLPNYLPNKGIFAAAKQMKDKLDYMLALGGLDAALRTIGDHVNPFETVKINDLQEAEAIIARTAWWTQLNLAFNGFEERAGIFTAAMESAEARSHEPESSDDVISAFGALVDPLGDDWFVSLKMYGAGIVLSNLAVALSPLTYAYVLKLLYSPDDMGLMKLISSARADYAQHKAKQSAETLAPPAPPIEEMTASDLVPVPPRAYSQKELADANAAWERLKLHLVEHSEHYSNTFYRQENPELRMSRLEGMGVAQFVENRLLGFSGTSAIYPLRLESLPENTQTGLRLLLSPTATDSSLSSQQRDISLPTEGVVTEAILGECEALEPYLIERRKHDLRARELQNKILEQRLTESGPNAVGNASPDGG